jgi:thiol-disulfide isomerase/thioredoxin
MALRIVALVLGILAGLVGLVLAALGDMLSGVAVLGGMSEAQQQTIRLILYALPTLSLVGGALAFNWARPAGVLMLAAAAGWLWLGMQVGDGLNVFNAAPILLGAVAGFLALLVPEPLTRQQAVATAAVAVACLGVGAGLVWQLRAPDTATAPESTVVSEAPCPPDPEAAAAVDSAATGHLASLNGTGTGRFYGDMKFLDPAGQPTSVAAFAGKMLLINFWASWCIPCRAEMPALDELAGQYNSETFMVLPVNTGETQQGKAAAFLEEGGWTNLPLYVDPDFSVIDRLKTTAVSIGLPASVLVDEKGCEIGVLQGPAEWNTPDGHRVIEALLAT